MSKDRRAKNRHELYEAIKAEQHKRPMTPAEYERAIQRAARKAGT